MADLGTRDVKFNGVRARSAINVEEYYYSVLSLSWQRSFLCAWEFNSIDENTDLLSMRGGNTKSLKFTLFFWFGQNNSEAGARKAGGGWGDPVQTDSRRTLPPPQKKNQFVAVHNILSHNQMQN